MEVFGRKYFDGEEVYSDWFPREGDNAIFRAEVIGGTPGTGLEVKIQFYTKNTEETTNPDGQAIVTSASTNPPAELALDVADTTPQELAIFSTAATPQPQGFRELVRFRVSASGGDPGEWLLVRIFRPIFFDAAESA